MNLSRLLVLADLSGHGARHGHAIRRDAEQTDVSAWGGVSMGAIYRELRELEEEGLIEALRTETEGRRPARTIYQITDMARNKPLSAAYNYGLMEGFTGNDPKKPAYHAVQSLLKTMSP